MGGKQMEGDQNQLRKMARDAREHGKQPSEVGASHGSSKQRVEAGHGMSHQEKVDLKTEGKQEDLGPRHDNPEARPGSRDTDSPDSEKHPRL